MHAFVPVRLALPLPHPCVFIDVVSSVVYNVMLALGNAS